VRRLGTLVPRRRAYLLATVAAAIAATLVAAAVVHRILWDRSHQGQALRIRDDRTDPDAAWPRPTTTPRAGGHGLPFISSVAPGGRYFLDQYGKPILVKGDAPWALLTKVSPDQARSWFETRRSQGFNAAIVSLIGATANGGPQEDGSTFDGLQPFKDGDILRWQEPYWQRATAYLRLAAENGITVMLYPIDGWTIGQAFVPTSIQQCRSYGRKVAERFRDLPNIVWMSGGDYFPTSQDLARGSDVDHCLDAMMRGIREAGDSRLFSMQLGFLKSISTQNPYWASRVDWNFVYTYFPTYRAVLEAYARTPALPAVLGESNYEGENGQPQTPPTTNATLRRQVLWSLTSGAAGDFMGSHDWKFNAGWESRLSTPSVTQISRLRQLFSDLPWWQLVPDTAHRLVTGGRGIEVTNDGPMDVLDNDYVTASETPDGRLAVVYLPTRHTISLNRHALAPGIKAVWIDPTTGARRAARVSDSFTSPGINAGGDTDWVLLLSS
jgi:hypothetical protein